MATIGFLFAQATPSIAFAGFGSASCLLRALHSTLDEVKADFLSIADRKGIESVLAKPELSSGEKAQEVFDIVLNARLRGVPEVESNYVRDVYRRIRRKPSEDSIDGHFLNLGKGSIKVSVPKAYVGTMLEYSVIAHELEHALQNVRVKGEMGTVKETAQRLAQTTSSIFAQEEGAMRAEWAYLHSFSDGLRRELIEEVNRDTKITLDAKSFLLRALLSASNEAESYLEVQRHAGRYSRSSIAWTTVPIRVGLASVMGVQLVLAGTKAACASMIDSHGGYPRTRFFSRVCAHLAGIREEIAKRGGYLIPDLE